MHFTATGCLAALLVVAALILGNATELVAAKRTFEVDWANDRFLKDGEPFRFIGGSFHYFRAHPDSWQRKLRTMRAAGLNAVTTYVEWSLHNPKDGVYVWDGIADLERFIENAMAEDLLVILRPGPYICAERDFGGLPYWLLSKYPNIKLRTSDNDYLHEVHLWYSQLMTKMEKYLYGNGGPIIMVQVENEYGSYSECDWIYQTWLRDETLYYVKDKAVLFTNDVPDAVRCGHIDGVLTTLDFGATNYLNYIWRKLRLVQERGPLVNTEYYPGWLTHWGEGMARVSTESISDTFIEMLDAGASVNFYMFYGGTNFGFTAGANDGGSGRYVADITSYDYDAPMTEAGDPTPKYFALREIISRYLPLPNVSVPEPVPKQSYGNIKLQACCSLLSQVGRQQLAAGVVISDKPKTFENLGQFSGLVLYETYLLQTLGFSILSISGTRDRALVYVENEFVGILSRESGDFDLRIPRRESNKLQILVENQGRINYGPTTDSKGIVGDVTLDGEILSNWTMTKFPLESYEDIESLIQQQGPENESLEISNHGPKIFYGSFEINDISPSDTYLDPTGWTKGIAFVNGINLGRYWPNRGPQVNLYVPAEILKVGVNKVVLIEYETPAATAEITFSDKPNLNGNRN